MNFEFLVERDENSFNSTVKDPRTLRQITRCRACMHRDESKNPGGKFLRCKKLCALMPRMGFCCFGKPDYKEPDKV